MLASRHHFESIPHDDGLEIKVDLIVVGIFRPPTPTKIGAAWLFVGNFSPRRRALISSNGAHVLLTLQERDRARELFQKE